MDNNSKRNFPSQGVLSMRLIVGLYLNYLAYTLFKGRAESSMKPVTLYLFIVIFVACGLFLCIKTIMSYTKGEYIGGKADVEESTSEEADVEESASEEDANAEEIASEEGANVDKSAPEEGEDKIDIANHS